MAQPQAGALIFDLFPSSSIRGKGEAHPSLELPPEVDYVTLVLHLQEAVPGQLLEVEVEDPRGTRLWRGELRVSDLGTARLGLPRSFLRTGKHHLRAFAGEGSTRHEAASFPLEIALPSDKD